MPLFEYVLVALMGAAGHSGATPITNLGPDNIAQPNGGALSPNPMQEEKKRKVKTYSKHRKHRHRRKRDWIKASGRRS
jgi:hypothetical protein